VLSKLRPCQGRGCEAGCTSEASGGSSEDFGGGIWAGSGSSKGTDSSGRWFTGGPGLGLEHLVFCMEYYKTIVDEFLILLSAFTTKSTAFTESRVAVEQFLEAGMGTLLDAPPQVVGSQLPVVSTLRRHCTSNCPDLGISLLLYTQVVTLCLFDTSS
jgi:hypothetical protein